VIVWIARLLGYALLRRIAVGSLVVVESGKRRRFGAGAPTATVEVRSGRAWQMLLRGSRGLAEAYEDGLWDSPDVVSVFRLAAVNATGFDRARTAVAPLLSPVQRLAALRSPSTRARNRLEIAAHYDLGTELFARMLDPTLSYSCAVFEHAQITLEQAQLAKLERVCEKLALEPGDRVVEIGTGWGGFAVYAASTRGCHVTTTTISHDQYEYATKCVRDAGLSDRVTVLTEDYRDLAGHYDKLVSIEMIEAVGWRQFGTFLAKCSRLLAPDGVMLLQAITIDDRAYEVEKASRSFMRTHIFPNGCLPSLEVIARCVARHTDLRTVDLEDLTPHYAETVRRWRANVEREADALAALGYDERFRRMWRMYLAYCEGGFAERRIGVVQTVLAKPHWRGSVRAGVTAPPPAVSPVAAAG